MNLVTSSEDSILAAVSGVLAPLLAPVGLGDWKICTALISGFMAKESVVSTLEVLFGGSVTAAMTPLGAAALLVFSLLYTPCVAAVAAVRRELGTKWAVGVVVWQCVLAWLAAFAIYAIGGVIGI
jgi:ferrous iron transport protein B